MEENSSGLSKVARTSVQSTSKEIRKGLRAPLYVSLLRDADISRGVKRCTTSVHHNDLDDDQNLDASENVLLDPALTKRILSIANEDHDDSKLSSSSEDEGSVGFRELKKSKDTQDFKVDKEDLIDFEHDNFVLDAEKFMESNAPTSDFGKSVLLSDLILEKILASENKEKDKSNQHSSLDPKIVDVYESIGDFLSKYKSGRLPKAFKIIPSLTNWEEILCLTKPVEWSPNSMHEAVRIFSSNLKPRMAQRFYNLVLLPSVRENIQTYKKLNFHYYQALKLAFYKPSAWFQGILFPLLLQNCTLREAVIFGSVLGKVSIPPLHVAAALVRLSDLHKGNTMNWSICTTYIINVLLNKKCALPKSSISAVVNHFATFLTDTRQLPVLWHQCFLTLVQRYKLDFTPDHRTIFRQLLKTHIHHLITSEIRREINYAESVKWFHPKSMEVD